VRGFSLPALYRSPLVVIAAISITKRALTHRLIAISAYADKRMLPWLLSGVLQCHL
jgi:hypothetical protein